MCKVKSCDRPSFVGGLCGRHALEGWCASRLSRRGAPSRLVPAARALALRRPPAARPASP
jgi:hypothetical protein